MVNTFFPRSTPQRSVKCLDSRRLNKQIVEAMQILNLLNDANYIVNHYSLDKCPEGKESGKLFYERVIWFKNVFKVFKDKKDYLCCNKKTNEYFITSDKNIFDKYLTSNHRKITGKGFVCHPTTLSWIGFIDALKHYINLCIDEWILRGNKNNRPKYILSSDNIIYPFWCTWKPMNSSHKSALIRKEIARNEPKWYMKKKYMYKIINTPYISAGYLWLTHLDEDIIDQAINNTLKFDIDYCDKINNDELSDDKIKELKEKINKN